MFTPGDPVEYKIGVVTQRGVVLEDNPMTSQLHIEPDLGLPMWVDYSQLVYDSLDTKTVSEDTYQPVGDGEEDSEDPDPVDQD